MALLDNEPEELFREHDETRPAASSSWRRPLQMAGLGLLLMLGGYAAMNYVPPTSVTPRQAEQERIQTELRELATKRQASGVAEDSLSDRVEQIRPPWRMPPYQIPGRLALYGGLFLFVAAGVLMYRHSPMPKDDGE
jgi:hypothetical protein